MVEQRAHSGNARLSSKGVNLKTVSGSKPVIRVCSLSLLIGRNRMLVLNIFKYVNFRRQALATIGQLSKKYASFVKQDMAMFDLFEKEKRSNHVATDQEFSEFLQECCGTRSTKDYSIELYLSAIYLPRFLAECTQMRIRDLYVIFENNQNASKNIASALPQLCPQNRILQRLRKLEFSHSNALPEHEFVVVHQLLSQTTRNLNRLRIDHVKMLTCLNQIGLNSFVKLKKLRIEHLEATGSNFAATYELFIGQLKINTSLTFIKLERVFT